jgi:hypothetical protein
MSIFFKNANSTNIVERELEEHSFALNQYGFSVEQPVKVRNCFPAIPNLQNRHGVELLGSQLGSGTIYLRAGAGCAPAV